jgi:hypothetical protein
MRTLLLMLCLSVIAMAAIDSNQVSFFDPDGAITPSVAWSGGTVTITNIPATEGGYGVEGVVVDGNAATHDSGTWTATAGSGQTHTFRVFYGLGGSYAGDVPTGTTSPTLDRE